MCGRCNDPVNVYNLYTAALKPILVYVPSKAYTHARMFAGITVSNSVQGMEIRLLCVLGVVQVSVSQPPGRGPAPSSGINYTGPREALLEFVILVF